MSTLSKWLDREGLTQATFAARLGVPQSTVSRWCSGVVPKARHIRAIAAETRGEVPPSAWFGEVETSSC